MATHSKNKKPKDTLEDFIELESLPDLVDDEETVGLDSVLDSEAVKPEEISDNDDEGPLLETIEYDITFEDESWTEDDESALDAGLIDMNDMVTDLDDATDETPLDADATYIDDWFDDVDDTPPAIDDGEEGPLTDEVFDIDTAKWADLEDEQSAEDEDESIFETMKRLELSIEEESSTLSSDERQRDELDVFYIGPTNGELQAVLFQDGVPVGVGDTVYLSGADQMLYAITSMDLSDISATSLTGKKGALFIGTATQGAYRVADRCRTYSSINSWFTEGLKSDDSVQINTCSTSFNVTGQETEDGFRLLGWTGEGQLYASFDDGETWTGPLLKGRSCGAVKASRCGGNQVLVLASSKTEVGVLLLSHDLEQFIPLALPSRLKKHLTPSNAVFDVASDVMAVGIDIPGVPLYISSDAGESWKAIKAVTDVTALVIDPDEPNWIAVALAKRDGTSAVVISEDRGRTWKRVFTRDPRRDKSCRITALSLNNRGALSLIALTEGGAYLITFDQKELTH